MRHAETQYMGVLEEELKTAILEAIPAAERLRGLPPEDRLRGLSPEERLCGLSQEDLVRLRELLEQEQGP